MNDHSDKSPTARGVLTYPRVMLGNRRTERGASAVEYGLLVVGVAAMLFVIAQTLGVGLSTIFEREDSKLCETCNVSSSTP